MPKIFLRLFEIIQKLKKKIPPSLFDVVVVVNQCDQIWQSFAKSF